MIHQLTDLSLLLWLVVLHRARQKLLKVPAHSREEISINIIDTVMNLSLLC